MNASLYIKKIPFFESTLAYVFFKNLSGFELDQFFETLSETFYNEELVPVSVIISGNQGYEKSWRKQAEQAFDENPWINVWFPSPEETSVLTGYFLLVGKGRIKTLLSDAYMLKMIELPETKLGIVGEIKNKGNKDGYSSAYKNTLSHITEALAFCGCNMDHLYQGQWCLPVDWANEHKKMNPDLQQILFQIKISPLQVSFFGIAIHSPGKTILETKRLLPFHDTTLKVSAHQISDAAFTHVHLIIESEGNLHSESEKISLCKKVIDHLAELNPELPVQWNQLVKGIVYVSDKNSTRQIKEYLKEQKIPLSTLLFFDAVASQQSWFEFDFLIPA